MVHPENAAATSDSPSPSSAVQLKAAASTTAAATTTTAAAAATTTAESNPQPPAPSSRVGYAHLFKYVVVGDSGGGKTALVKRFSTGQFQETRDYTIGVDFDIKTLPLPNGDQVKLQMWDTAGQERFRNITTSYYRGCHAIFIVYDVNNKETFDNVRMWYREAEAHCNDDTVRAIIGNKVDLQEPSAEVWGKAEVEKTLTSEGIALSSPGGVFGVYETSAKTGEGVGEVFGAVTEELVNRRLNERNPLRGGGGGRGKVLGRDTVRVGGEKTKPKGRCC